MKNKKVFIVIILSLIMLLLFVIKQEYLVNHKEKLEEYLKFICSRRKFLCKDKWRCRKFLQ